MKRGDKKKSYPFYPDDTEGKRLAERTRQRANRLSVAERRRLQAEALEVIYGQRRGRETVHAGHEHSV